MGFDIFGRPVFTEAEKKIIFKAYFLLESLARAAESKDAESKNTESKDA